VVLEAENDRSALTNQFFSGRRSAQFSSPLGNLWKTEFSIIDQDRLQVNCAQNATVPQLWVLVQHRKKKDLGGLFYTIRGSKRTAS